MEKAFYELAGDYCRFLAEREITKDSVPALMELLMKLYVAALRLPKMQPETNTVPPSEGADKTPVRISGQIPSLYWEVFDPFVPDGPVCGDLSDDLSDIAADLMLGIMEYDAGRIGNAVFAWSFGFDDHWGSHAADALRALHSIRTA